MVSNAVREKLANGEPVFGPMISFVRNPEIAWVLAACDFDFFVIDMEHSPIGMESVAAIVAAARATGVVPMVRPPSKTSDDIPRALDVGAEGLLIPRVETPEDVRNLLETTKYDPMGSRGMALTRAHTLFRKPVDAREYMQYANSRTITAIQIESRGALENLSEIVSAGGIDVVFVGPADLSQSFGLHGQSSHPRIAEAIERVAEFCGENGMIAGTMVHDLDSAQRYLAYGVRFLIYSNDIGLLSSAGSGAVGNLKRLSAELAS